MDRPRATTAGRKRMLVLTLLLASLIVVGPARAATPTAQDVRGWLSDLSNRSPTRREAAYHHLMSLSRPGLDVLQQVIKDHPRELAPQQDFLHDVVLQAFLASEPYGIQPAAGGFLGVQFDDDQIYEDSPFDGVEIRHMFPGLCASKYLEEGDIVLAVTVEKDTHPLHSAGEMKTVISSLPAGQEVTLTVVRRGRTESIDMVLGGRPANVEFVLENFLAERQTEAEAYWDDHFAGLFNPAATPTPPPAPARASADR